MKLKEKAEKQCFSLGIYEFRIEVGYRILKNSVPYTVFLFRSNQGFLGVSVGDRAKKITRARTSIGEGKFQNLSGSLH